MTTLERTPKRLRVAVAVGCLAIAGVLTCTANADPTNDNSVTVTLFNCSGPAGTPTSFTITRIPATDPVAHVVQSTDVFRRTLVIDLTTGQSFAWGYNDSKPLITCSAVGPNGHLFQVTGFFTGS